MKKVIILLLAAASAVGGIFLMRNYIKKMGNSLGRSAFKGIAKGLFNKRTPNTK